MEYLTPEKVQEFNLLILTMINVKKADSPELLSYTKLVKILDECKNSKGDVYEKAVILLKGLVQGHVFASGNRRTAFIATKYFLNINNSKMRIKNSPDYSRIMVGIREGYYTDDEIKEWIKYGKIKEFKR